MDTVPIAPISGGLNESTAPGEQPQGTYREGVNVRGIGPKSGRRVWGAQRAGLRQIGDAFEGAYPRHVAFAAKLLNAFDFVELSPTADPDATPSAVAVAWTARLGEQVLDVAEGPLDGAGYFLVASGDVVVVNPEGTEQEDDRVTSATPQGFTAVPRVFVDEQGAVYTAATRDRQFEGGAGRVYRWVKDADGIWAQAWEAVIQGPISTFVVDRGLLYIAEEGLEDEDVEVFPALTRIGAPTLGPEIAWRQTIIPQPVLDLAVTKRGQCLLSSPTNQERAAGSSAGGFTARAVDWTPPEIVSWETNAWAWVDAFAVNGEDSVPEDGAVVTRMRDRRFEPTEFDPVNDTSPVRELRAPDSGIFSAPTWSQEAFGGQGGIRFTSRSALISGPARALPADIPADTAAGSTHECLIPSDFTSWTAAMIVQFTDVQGLATAIRQILQQRNSDAGEPDWLLQVDGLDVSFSDDETSASTDQKTVATTANTAIISISVADASFTRLWINGDEQLPLTLTPTPPSKQDGPYPVGNSGMEFDGPFTVIGGGRPNRINILNHPGTALQFVNPSGTAGSFGVLEVIRDGEQRRSSAAHRVIIGDGAPPILGLGIPEKIRVDFGTALRMDSFAFWSSSSRFSARRATVRFGTDPTFAVWDVEQIVELSRGQGDDNAVRDEFAIDDATGQSYRFMEIDPTVPGDYFDRNAWQLTEVEVFLQDTGEALSGADFYLGEFVAIRNTNTSEREFLEGYLAHRWGVSHTLPGTHPHFGVGNVPSGAGSTNQDSAAVAANFTSPFPILAKYGTDGTPLAAYTGAGVGLGAAESDGRVWAFGDPEPTSDPTLVADHGTLLSRFDDGPRNLVREAGLASSDRPAVRSTPLALGPCDSVFVPFTPLSGSGSGVTRVRRFDGDTLAQEWELPIVGGLHSVVTGGFQFDGTLQGLGCGPEFLYLAAPGVSGAQRVDVLGLRRTGNEARRDVERLAVLSNGDVYRENGSGWGLLEAGALPGPLPYSVTLGDKTILADGQTYRVYVAQTGQFRRFEESVKGQFPKRCQLIAAYRNRLLLARGDNAFTLYQSAFGDPFDFEFGREVVSVEQAAAGTIAKQGDVPEPITALMPFSDDYLFIGTTEGLWVLSGDLSDSGRLDQVDRAQGVAFGYAWCHAQGVIYYFSARGGVVRISPGTGRQMVSEGAIQRRMEDIDLSAVDIRMAYNFVDKTVHVYAIPKDLGRQVQHFVFEEPTGAWHVDDFGEGLGGVVTSADTLAGDEPDDRALVLGFGDGRVCAWDQYADDDAGRQIRSSALVGPLVPDSADVEVRVAGAWGTLASDLGAIEVAARASATPDRPGASGPFRTMQAGRQRGVPLNVTAPAVWLEVRGTGRPWEVHQLRAELARRGSGRRIR